MQRFFYNLLFSFVLAPLGVIAQPLLGNDNLEFTTPQLVEISGLPIGVDGTAISTEEPFISRDGQFLFFNTGHRENNKDLHYAKKLAETWVYQSEIGPNINDKKEVQGNPTMDVNNNFFYVDSGVKRMIRIGQFSADTGQVINVKDVDAIPNRDVKLFAQHVDGNMGVEVSSDGNTVYFSRARWAMNVFSLGKLMGSNILFLSKKNKKYVFDEVEIKRIMKHINSPDLEYAASISDDGLELFFTRFVLADLQADVIRSMIMHATRTSISSPFDPPQIIESIGRSAFVEGPAISNTNKELYYHKLEGAKFKIYKVSR